MRCGGVLCHVSNPAIPAQSFASRRQICRSQIETGFDATSLAAAEYCRVRCRYINAPSSMQDLHDEIQAQLAACDAILQSKNGLIKQIEKDLKTKDNDFAKLLKQQSEDVDALLKHMGEQSTAIDEACRCARGALLAKGHFRELRRSPK